jgi:hypothetical protein
MPFELNNLIEEELTYRLKSAKVGVIVRGFIEVDVIDVGLIVSNASQKLNRGLYVATVGYNGSNFSSDVELSNNIEDAVQWRNTPSCAGSIVVFVQDEAAKMHSLADFDTLTARDVINRLLYMAKDNESLAENNPQRDFWSALQRDTSFLQLNMLLDYVKAIAESDDLNVISRELWRIGLLVDEQILRADVDPRERLSRNRSILLEMERLSDASKKRMKRNLTRTKSTSRDQLRFAYRLLMSFYSTGDRRILADLDLDTVEQLLKSGKPEPKSDDTTPSSDDEDIIPPPSRPLQGKELDRMVADCVVSGNDEDQDALRELGDAIHEFRENPQESPDDFTLTGRQVKVSLIPNKLLELIELACLNAHWGGILETSKSDLKTITNTWENDDFSANTPDGDKGLFDLFQIFEEEYLEIGGLFTDSLNRMIEARNTLTTHLDLLVNYPLILFGGYPEVRAATEQYLQAYADLLRRFRQNEPELHRRDSMATRDVASQLLNLDVIYIRTPDEWKAILTPLHPLHLWRFCEIAKALSDDDERDFTEAEKQQLVKALPEIPHLLHFIIVNPNIAGTNDIVLPQSGNLGFLPTYENRTNRYLGTDGLDFLTTLLKQWLSYAPYSRSQVRVALIDVPDLAFTLQSLAKYLSNNQDLKMVLSVYSTRNRNYQIELARLDYDDKDYQIAELMRQGRLRVMISSVCQMSDIVKQIERNPVHIAYAFDQALPQMEKSPRAYQLVVSPLVITYEYEYSEAYGRGTITPSSAAEEGLFGDYYFVVERAGQLPSDTELRLKYGEDVNITPFNDLLEKGCVRWLAIADRVLTAYYAPESGIPLGERRIGQREVAVWALKSTRAVQRFVELLRRYNLKPHEEIVVEMIKQFGHISSEGILSLPSIIGNAVARASQEKGLLGTLLAAKWYTSLHPDALIASLDTELAKNWLQGRTSTNERADLIGVRVTEDERIIIEPIEVKTHQNLASSDVRIARDKVTGQIRLEGHAIDQLTSIINTLRPIFGGVDEQPLFTPARRETLKYQLYRECFREVHDENWRRDWYNSLRDAFSDSKERVSLHGLVLHIQMEQSGKHEVTFDEVEPITFVRIGTDEIQKLIEPGGQIRIEDLSNIPVNRPRSTSPKGAQGRPIEETEDLDDDFLEPLHLAKAQTDSDPSAENVVIPLDETSIYDEVKHLARLFLRSCESYRIQIDECDPAKAQLGPNVWRLYVTLASGQSLRPLQTHLEDISREMGRSGLLLTNIPNDKRIALDIPRLEREIVYFDQALAELPKIKSPEEMPITIGVTPEGDQIIRHLDDMPHLLIGGTTGSGKTMFLYSILASLLYTHPNPEHLRLFLTSSGLEDFVFFEGLPHLETGHVVTDAAEALAILQNEIIHDFEARSNILTEGRCRNISEFNAQNSIPLPPLVLVIDEFADLSDQLAGNKAAKQQFHDNIRRIAQLGRKRGVHLVLCTQRPSADLVPTNIRSLLNARVALRVNDSTASRMILEEIGAEQLQSAGDLLFKEQASITRAQSYYVQTGTLEDIVMRLSRK